MLEVYRFCKFTTRRRVAPYVTRSLSSMTFSSTEEIVQCKCCEINRHTTKYKRKIYITGMPRVAVFLWALFLTSLLSTVSARSIPGSPSIEESQDIYRLLDNIQERDPKALTYMKELALLLDKLKQQPLESMQDAEESLPVPMAMQGRPLQGMQEGPRDDKRGSYMSLCHFKICNMGRKRGYWNPWNRT